MACAVERGARVLRDAAVDDDKRAVRLTLYREDPVEGRSRRADQGAARLDPDLRNRNAVRSRLSRNALGYLANRRRDIERFVVRFGTRLDAESSTDHEPPYWKAPPCKALGRCGKRRGGCQVRLDLADLRADVRVQAGEERCGIFAQHGCRCGLVARMDSEFGVVAAGADERVRARLDADVETEYHLRARSVARETHETSELFDSIHRDKAQPAAARGAELFVGLSGAVQRDALRRKAGPFRRDQLAQRADV